jgi:hypothetical protein
MELFEFNIMPSDLTNVPATFQRLIDEIVDRINWKLRSNYLDDFMIGLLSFEEHIDNFSQVFECLSQINLAPNSPNAISSEKS